jgi:hypothetical protein
MSDNARHFHFTRSLEHFSTRLDELLETAHLHQSQLPPELIDEIAYTTGELMLVLTNHAGHQEEGVFQVVLSHARELREHLRNHQLKSEQITKACDTFSQEIGRLVMDSKKAA